MIDEGETEILLQIADLLQQKNVFSRKQFTTLIVGCCLHNFTECDL